MFSRLEADLMEAAPHRRRTLPSPAPHYLSSVALTIRLSTCVRGQIDSLPSGWRRQTCEDRPTTRTATAMNLPETRGIAFSPRFVPDIALSFETKQGS